MSTNLFARFKKLFEGPPLLTGTVTSAGGGFATVQLPDGGTLNVRGAASFGQKVFVRDGVIEGAAPSLTLTTIEI